MTTPPAAASGRAAGDVLVAHDHVQRGAEGGGQFGRFVNRLVGGGRTVGANDDRLTGHAASPSVATRRRGYHRSRSY